MYFSYLETSNTRSITLEPCEITTGVGVEKVRLWGLTNVDGDIIGHAKTIPMTSKHSYMKTARQSFTYHTYPIGYTFP